MHHQLGDDGKKFLSPNELFSAGILRTVNPMPFVENTMNKNNIIGSHTSTSDFVSRNTSEASSIAKNLNGNDNPNYYQDEEVMELYSRVKAQKVEILSLREQIAGASVRELKLLNEKYMLDIKFADLRMALDEKQNEIINFASEELARRKVDMENNLNLVQELKDAEDERYIYVSSMVKILAEYGIYPRVVNASTLINNIKHLHDQLQLKIRNSHDRIGDIMSSVGKRQNNNKSFDKGTPGFNSTGQVSVMSPQDQQDFSFHNNLVSEHHLEPQVNLTGYMHENDQRQIKSSRPNVQMLQHLHNDNQPKTALHSTNYRAVSSHVPISFAGSRLNMRHEGRINDYPHSPANMVETDVSYVVEDDGPGIEGFQIIGDAIPGGKLLGCGIPVRGTSLCIFQWVRHLQDGTWEYIEGATNPEYIVTVDDVDKVIAVECIPMDDQGRQGEIVRLFANEQNKITCDPDMKMKIDSYLSEGEAAFNVLLLMDSSENWEATTLILKKSGCQIQKNKTQGVVFSERFSNDLSIQIPPGISSQFVLKCSDGSSHPFNAYNDIRLRDTLVLTFRMFQRKSLDEKKKGKA